MKIQNLIYCLSIVLVSLTGPAWSETVDVNGFEMYYEVVGEGEPLLLLHGFYTSGATWRPPVRARLAQNYQLIVPDLRGHGSSTNPAGQFTHRQAALDIFALLESLELERVKAIGISTGGMTLLHMATQQPDRIEAMVLIGSTIYFPEQARQIMRAQNPNDIPEQRMQRMREIHTHGDDQILALGEQFASFADSYDDMNFTGPYLSTISARTLIIQGDRDAFFPARIALEMYESIPNSYLWIIPNGGHIPVFGPVQDHFLCTATGFLSDQWQPGRIGAPSKLCE